MTFVDQRARVRLPRRLVRIGMVGFLSAALVVGRPTQANPLAVGILLHVATLVEGYLFGKLVDSILPQPEMDAIHADIKELQALNARMKHDMTALDSRVSRVEAEVGQLTCDVRQIQSLDLRRQVAYRDAVVEFKRRRLEYGEFDGLVARTSRLPELLAAGRRDEVQTIYDEIRRFTAKGEDPEVHFVQWLTREVSDIEDQVAQIQATVREHGESIERLDRTLVDHQVQINDVRHSVDNILVGDLVRTPGAASHIVLLPTNTTTYTARMVGFLQLSLAPYAREHGMGVALRSQLTTPYDVRNMVRFGVTCTDMGAVPSCDLKLDILDGNGAPIHAPIHINLPGPSQDEAYKRVENEFSRTDGVDPSRWRVQ